VRYIGAKYAQNNIDADEEWWFINGTGVNGDLQAANGYHISEIFQKQVRLFYNPTTGLLFDFAQCVVGLLSYKTRPSTQLAKSLLTSFSRSPTVKVILVVHSMGAIIAANAIKYLIRKGLTKDLYRLELYTFGSPAVEFLHVIDKGTMKRAPFYEHYVNTHDYFGSIGALRLVDAHWWAVGRVFTRERRGHFFGEHYLTGIPTHEYKWRGSTSESRLYSYLPPYPTPIPSDNPYVIPEYKINPRRPRRNMSLTTTVPTTHPASPTMPPLTNSPTIVSSPTTHLPQAPPSMPSTPYSESTPTSTPSTLDATNIHPPPVAKISKADTFVLPSDPSRFLFELEQLRGMEAN